MKKNICLYFLVCGGLSKYDVGVARGTVFEETRPGTGFKIGDFDKKKLGGLDRRTTRTSVIHTSS